MFEIEFTATSILIAVCLACVAAMALYCGVVATWAFVDAAAKALGV